MIRIALVVAIAENGVIGHAGALPWRISDDLKWFKKVTMGKPVIMGRKTYESIGKPLPGRKNIIITRMNAFQAEGMHVAGSITEAVASGRQFARAAGEGEVCIIGGGEIYAQAIGMTDRLYVTRVNAKVEGDVRFPSIAADQWAENIVGNCIKSERNQYACEFVIFDRLAEAGETPPI